MRHSGIVLERVGVALGQTSSADAAIVAGQYTREQQRKHRQQSVLRAENTTGPELAVRAARAALAGTRDVDLHLHASILDPGCDFWPPNAYVAHELGLAVDMTARLEAMSNSMVLGVEMAARLLPGLGGRALLTCGDVFAPPLFDPWSADVMPYGDAGAAATLASGGPGVADVVATASCSDPGMEVLNRGEEFYACAVQRPSVRVADHKRRGLLSGDDVERRTVAAVQTVVKTALYDADLAVSDLDWLLAPNYPPRLLARHCLNPLGFDEDQTLARLGRRYGHCGAADQIVAVDHLDNHGRLRAGAHVLLLGIGVGMTFTAAVLRCRGEHSRSQQRGSAEDGQLPPECTKAGHRVGVSA